MPSEDHPKSAAPADPPKPPPGPPAEEHEPPRQPSASAEKKPDDEKPSPPKRRGTGWFWFLIVLLAVVLAAIFVVRVFLRRGTEKERQQTSQAQQAGARSVQVTKAQRSPASFDFSLPGNAQALQEAVLYARTNGYLRERLADIGDRVEAGQLLARIEAPDVDAQLRQGQATLEQRRANLEIARVTFEREKKLLSEKVVSQQEFDQNQATFRQAEADVRAAEANVQNLNVQQGFQRITAPFTGVITERNLDVGALINSGAGTTAPSLFRIAQTDILRVYIYVPQSYSASIKNGNEVQISAPQYAKETFRGRVTRSADSLDPVARTERVEIQLPSEDGRLLPGMYLTVRFTVAQAEPALLVPANTLDVRREGPRVAVVGSDNKVSFKGVSLGRDFGTTIEITAGLSGDEQLVVSPTTDLQAGEQVEIAKPEAKKG